MIPETQVYKTGVKRTCAKCKEPMLKGTNILIVSEYSRGWRGSVRAHKKSYCRLCAVKILQEKVTDEFQKIEEALGLVGEGA